MVLPTIPGIIIVIRNVMGLLHSTQIISWAIIILVLSVIFVHGTPADHAAT